MAVWTRCDRCYRLGTEPGEAGTRCGRVTNRHGTRCEGIMIRVPA